MTSAGAARVDRDEVFLELTKSVCPVCKGVIDAEVNVRDNRVIMRKRCREHGVFEALVYSDAELYLAQQRFNKPGTMPLEFQTEVRDGCPLDCGLCPDHKQHTCLGVIEVNTGCNLDCPICFADSGHQPDGYSLTHQQVELMLDTFVAAEGSPEVVQFSGGEPTIHPQILDFIALAQAKGIKAVMLNTNGIRHARDPQVRGGARGARAARLPAVRRLRGGDAPEDPRQGPARRQGACARALRGAGADRDARLRGREGRERARGGRGDPVRRRPPGGARDRVSAGHALGSAPRLRPARAAHERGHDEARRRAGAGMAARRRLRPGPLLLPDLPLDVLRPRHRRRSGAACAPGRDRGPPRLPLQPGLSRPGAEGRAGAAVLVVGDSRRRARTAGVRELRHRPPRRAREPEGEGVRRGRAGLPGRLHAQRPPADEVLCRGDHPGRQADPVLRLQLGRLARAGARPALGRGGRAGRAKRRAPAAAAAPDPPRLPHGCRELHAWVACVADARPLDEIAALLEDAGLVVERTEARDEILAALLDQLDARLKVAGLVVRDAAARGRGLVAEAHAALDGGRLGYGVVVARRPARARAASSL